MVYALLIFLFALAGLGCYLAVTGRHTVPAGMVGLVYKRFGRRRPEEPNPRVSVFGALGLQAQILLGNSRYWLMPFLYRIRRVPQTHVPNGTIGVVVARVGAVQASRNQNSLARHVECNYFQDGVSFLRNGGEQGRQQQVLTGGYYDINTAMFEVITVNTPDAARRERLTAADLREVEIPIGETGVVITHVGTKPDQDRASAGRVVDGHENFQLPWKFLEAGGQKGVQEETFDEGGHYVVNPWFAHVVRIPIRVLILEWAKKKKLDSNLDISLDQIVLDVQGYTVRLDMKQTVQIPAEAAPGLVRRFGDLGARGYGQAPVQQFVEKELASTVDGYFRRICARYKIQEFITKYDEVCNELADEVRQALLPTKVKAIETTLADCECDEPEINDIRRRIAIKQEQSKFEQARRDELEAQHKNKLIEVDIDLQTVKVEQARKEVEYAEIKVLVGQIGPQAVALERIAKQLSKANVPQIISGGGNGDIAAEMLKVMPFVQVKDIVLDALKESSKNLPQADSQQAVTRGRTTDKPDWSNEGP